MHRRVSISCDQFLEGKKIAFADLQKGDPVFFAHPSKKSRINHVGIVTEEDNENNKFYPCLPARGDYRYLSGCGLLH